MVRSLTALLVVVVFLQSLVACSTKPKTTLGSTVSVPYITGQLMRQGSGDVLVNTDVTFLVAASGGTSYRFIRSDGGAVLNFSSSVSYTKRFAQVGQAVESGVLEALDINGDVVTNLTLSSAVVNVVGDGGAGGLDCTGLSAVPTSIAVAVGTNGQPTAPAVFNFFANTSLAATVTALATNQAVPIALQLVSPSNSLSHQFRGSISTYGNFVVRATFTSGSSTRSCEVPVEVKATQAGILAPSCVVVATPSAVNAGTPFQVTVTPGAQSPVTEVYVESARLPLGSYTTQLTKSVGTHQIAALVSGPGGVAMCSSIPVQVLPTGSPTVPSCNFSPTVYAAQVKVGQPVLYTMALNVGSALPTGVSINGLPAAPNPSAANQWQAAFSYPAPGVYTVEGRVSNGSGVGRCYSTPVTVASGQVPPVCSIALDNSLPEVGKNFVATLTHTNSAASGNALSVSIKYNGTVSSSTNPYPNFTKSLVAVSGAIEVEGVVNGPMGVGQCKVNVAPQPKACSGGVKIGNVCWYLGGMGQSCSSVCSIKGGYDSSAQYAAHSQSGCTNVLSQLWAPLPYAQVRTDKATGLSCFWYAETFSGWLHTGSAPTSGAAYPTARRACACRG